MEPISAMVIAVTLLIGGGVVATKVEKENTKEITRLESDTREINRNFLLKCKDRKYANETCERVMRLTTNRE